MRALVLSALAALISLLALSCSSDAGSDLALGGPPGGSGGGAPSDSGLPTSIDFEMVSDLAARQQVMLKVRALPARVYALRFALPTTQGDPLDAVLDRSEGSTDQSGIASVLLTAPSSPTTFEVRASVGEVAGSISLSVSDRGVATLQVEPSYPSALRDITTWIATAHPDKTCSDLPGIPPEDGPLKSSPAAKNEAPVIPEVPAGTRLAVTLRSGHYVGGCTSVEMLPPSAPDSPQVVKVTLLNRPIDLSASSLTLTLDLDPMVPTWGNLLTAAGPVVLGGLLGSSTDDVDSLLDAMRQASGDSSQAFESARQAEGWDTLLRGRWGQSAATKLRDTVSGWLGAGRQSFSATEHPFVGELSPLGQPKGVDVMSSAIFELTSVAGLDPDQAGFVDRADVSWSASADDTILLSTDLYFVRSKLAAGLAEAAALDAARALDSNTTQDSAPAVLAATLDCDGLAAALVAPGADATVAYAGCDAACLADACRSGLEAVWQRGAEVDGLTPSRLSVTASGNALVGDAAEVTGLSGKWLGELDDASTTQATGGELSASSVAPSP